MQTILHDQTELERLAADLAPTLRAGDAVLLSGPLGAGKTVFARALLRAACGQPEMDVPSPSYTLVQSYEAPRFTLHHFDLWRLAGPDALAELGWEDARAGVVIVEWPDRLGDLAPMGALNLALAPQADGTRLAGLTDERSKQCFLEKKDQKTSDPLSRGS